MVDLIILVILALILYLIYEFVASNWILILVVGIISLTLLILIKSRKHKKQLKNKKQFSKEKIYNADYFLYYDRNHFERKDGFAFETFIKEIFIKLGYTFVAAPGQLENNMGNIDDKGIDLIFETGKLPVLIQCKCYSYELQDDLIKKYSRARKNISKLINSNFEFLIVTNNYVLMPRNKALECYGIRLVELDQLRELYNLSTQIKSDFTFTYELELDKSSFLTKEKLSKCEVGDDLNFLVNKHCAMVFNNELKQRGEENNTLYKISDGIAVALTTLYSHYTGQLKCTIVEKGKNSLTIQIQLYKPSPTISNNYQKLLDAIFLNPAA